MATSRPLLITAVSCAGRILHPEIMLLPNKDRFVVQTTEFNAMKKELKKVASAADQDEKRRPTLRRRGKDCPPPQKLEYEPGRPIESLCPPQPAVRPQPPIQ